MGVGAASWDVSAPAALVGRKQRGSDDLPEWWYDRSLLPRESVERMVRRPRGER